MDGFTPVSCEQVAAFIQELRCKYSSLDPIPTWLLRKCKEELVPFIAELCNTSFTMVTFPSSMKHAIVIPHTVKTVINNYRSVSNLTFLLKLLERVASKQIASYLETHGLLPSHQSAHRVHHSAETALLKVHSDLISASDAGKVSLLAFLDMSSAFDTVDHNIYCCIDTPGFLIYQHSDQHIAA